MAEAKLNREYAFRIIGIGVLMVGILIWSIYDGKVAWPRANRQLDQVRPSLLATNLTAEAWLEKRGDGKGSLLDEAFGKAGCKVPSKLVRKVGELRLPDRLTGNRDEKRAALQVQLRKVFESPVYSPHDLSGQTVQAAIACLFALLAFGAVLAKVGKVYQADEKGLGGSGFGKSYGFDEIERIEWKQWKEKGIAVLFFKDGRRVKLDGWHFRGIPAIIGVIKEKRQDLTDEK